MPRGGKRVGAGRPKGTPNPETISKAEAREALRAVVMEHMREMVDAQIAHAKGLKYLVARNKKTGKFEKLTKEQAEKMLEREDESEFVALELWDKDPSVQAFTDLLNRAIDKPAEQVQEHAVSGTLKVIHEIAE